MTNIWCKQKKKEARICPILISVEGLTWDLEAEALAQILAPPSNF